MPPCRVYNAISLGIHKALFFRDKLCSVNIASKALSSPVIVESLIPLVFCVEKFFALFL